MPGITDVHVHVEPYRTLKPAIFKMLWPQVPEREKALRLISDPRAFLGHLDATGVERACLINYVAPEVMGFTEDVNRFVGEFAREDRKRLIPFGSVHPKRTKDAKRDVERLASKWEMGGMQIHPPHQLFPANGYVHGRLPSFHTIYKTAERLRMPVMVHTGTSVFPGARSKFGDPMDLDDVAQAFPDLTIPWPMAAGRSGARPRSTSSAAIRTCTWTSRASHHAGCWNGSLGSRRSPPRWSSGQTGPRPGSPGSARKSKACGPFL